MIAFVEFTLHGGRARTFQVEAVKEFAPHFEADIEDGTDLWLTDGLLKYWVEQSYLQVVLDIRWALYHAANAHETARTAKRQVRERAEAQS